MFSTVLLFREALYGALVIALACSVLGDWEHARIHADAIRIRDDFPRDVGDALATISAEDVDDLFQLLSKKDVREPTNWSRRFKNHQEKLKSGDVYQVAEVVRNLALREASKGLSAGEKAMLVKARGVLVSELSFALNLSEDDALKKLEEQLT